MIFLPIASLELYLHGLHVFLLHGVKNVDDPALGDKHLAVNWHSNYGTIEDDGKPNRWSISYD